MDDDAFAAYVLNNSPRYELETLEEIVKGLNNQIASRRWGKPPDLQIGSHVEATLFSGGYAVYGTVVRLMPKGCVVEPPDSTYADRISYDKYAVRVLDEFEWNRVCMSISIHREEYQKEAEDERLERIRDRESAIAERKKNIGRAKVMETLDGSVSIYRGAFVHAYRPDHDQHEYGVVVDMSTKKIVLSNAESDWESRVWVAKCEIELLDERQWEAVDREQRRRYDEYEEAKKRGKTSGFPDYASVRIKIN